MNKLKVFGVEIDEVTEDQVVDRIDQWILEDSSSRLRNTPSLREPNNILRPSKARGEVHSRNKHYIVTPNIEFLMAARKDSEFREILNKADLKIPDSSRFNWVKAMIEEKMTVRRLLIWPLFFIPSVKILPFFPVTTGADLMGKLIEGSAKKGYTVGIIGGSKGLAEKVGQRHLKSNKEFGIVFTDSNIKVDEYGNTLEWMNKNDILNKGLDILFVGFGQIKQEKWIDKNLYKIPAKVFIGVGGAIDYLSGDVARAPIFMRKLGLEWLFRLIIQPWRVKRFGKLVEFVFLILFEKSQK